MAELNSLLEAFVAHGVSFSFLPVISRQAQHSL
jgi:hypothetical protein